MIKGALALPLTPLVDTEVPDTLISAESLAAKKALQPPAWVPVGEKTSGGGAATLAVTSTIGIRRVYMYVVYILYTYMIVSTCLLAASYTADIILYYITHIHVLYCQCYTLHTIYYTIMLFCIHTTPYTTLYRHSPAPLVQWPQGEHGEHGRRATEGRRQTVRAG